MKRNKRNPGREKKRRRRAAGEETKREMGRGKVTPKRGESVSPVEQDRRRRRKARSEVPAELRQAADEMGVVLPGEKTAQVREQGGSDGQ